ncbi:IS66 family insertion sequence element accessory protein TnpA [Paenibacillus sp. YN15]|uniref:IS66 family insertion sequence element accessory protein TnpA n=1 Tax=Paenibacillus sp. YN15 TaxID=1742774 RepID=UPI000DCB20A8|nr:helix-turn-helix domain-containing protein [Paenibacillus sp. YN15]RAU90855.1 helix-turn-helix domain-containing protein [Paenibacillus sp. YN15]
MTIIERRRIWQEHLHQQAESGLPAGEWCEAHGIKRRQFQDWQRRLASSSSSESPKAHWVSLPLQTDPLASPNVLLVRVGAATIEVPTGFSPELLTDVVRALAVC